ncbi:hypothetical protein BJX76DRAFT_359471 [Aspergillus varians]
MSSIPKYHRAGSAASASASASYPVSQFFYAASTSSRSSVSSGSSRDGPSRIPKLKVAVSNSGQVDLTDGHSCAIDSTRGWEQEIQRRQAVDSELIPQLRSIERYKQEAISAEKKLLERSKENDELQSEVASLHGRLSDERILASQLQTAEGKNRELEKGWRLAVAEFNTERWQKRELEKTVDNLKTQQMVREEENEKAKFELEQTLRSAAQQLSEAQTQEEESRQITETLRFQLEEAEKEAKLHLTGRNNLVSEFNELRSRHQKAVKDKSDAEAQCADLLDQQRILEERCSQLDGLSESMAKFGAILNDIKEQQTATDNRVRGLATNRDEERERSNQDHLDIINRYSSHFNNMDELERKYGQRDRDLESRIAILQEGLRQSSNSSFERDTALAAQLGTMATSLMALPDQLERLIDNKEHPALQTLDQMRHKLTEAIAAMSNMYSQLVVNYELPREVQSEFEESNPSISSPVIGKGQPRFGWIRKKGEMESHM